MKTLPIAALALLFAGPAFAQTAGPDNVPVAAAPVAGGEKVNLVIVYGDDPCPGQRGDDIVICGRKDEKERYRIPEPLRGDPNAPANEAWAEKVAAMEYVGKTGTESCSPVGGGGFTGCFAKLAKLAKAERRQADNASWGDLVAAERARRLSTIDADSEAIEARVKAEEAAAKGQQGAATPPQ